MKAVLDHVGVAVRDLESSLQLFRETLGLDVGPPEVVASQRVRLAHVDTGAVTLELLESTSADSAVARFIQKRGPGLHHITLRVDNLDEALAHLKARNVLLVDEQPRPGAGGSRIAFIHPSSAHGVLVELKQSGRGEPSEPLARRMAFGDLELVSLCAGHFRLDGGAMFGVVPKNLWERKAAPDEGNRIAMAMRPLLVRGRRTMLIDAGAGNKLDAKTRDIYALDDGSTLDRALAAAGVAPEAIDIVLATHLHFDHAGGFTVRDSSGRLQPRFPRATYIVRRGEWDEAIAPNERSRASYIADNYQPLADAGVLQFVEEDGTIMPGVRVRRTGGHTMHHQLVEIQSGDRTAVFVADLIPTTAHLPLAWIMAYDLYPLDTLTFKRAFVRQAIDERHLVFFEHDSRVAAGYIRESGGKAAVEGAL